LSVKKDTVALVQRVRDGLAEAVEGEAMPIDFRDPFVFGVFPGALVATERTANFEPLFRAH
jgi:hypothetical protein